MERYFLVDCVDLYEFIIAGETEKEYYIYCEARKGLIPKKSIDNFSYSFKEGLNKILTYVSKRMGSYVYSFCKKMDQDICHFLYLGDYEIIPVKIKERIVKGGKVVGYVVNRIVLDLHNGETIIDNEDMIVSEIFNPEEILNLLINKKLKEAYIYFITFNKTISIYKFIQYPEFYKKIFFKILNIMRKIKWRV